MVHTVEHPTADLMLVKASSTSLLVVSSDERVFQAGFKITFGLFFGLAILALYLGNAPPKMYQYVIKLHFWGGFIAFLCLTIGFYGILAFIFLMEFLLQYVIPAASFILVVLNFYSNKVDLPI